MVHHNGDGGGEESLPNEFEGVDLAALDALIESDEGGLLDAPEKRQPITSTDRLERAFAEVEEFVREHGREPNPETREIAERKLGARLVGIRGDKAKVEHLQDKDELGLLAPKPAPQSIDDIMADDDFDLLGGDDSGIFDVDSLPQLPDTPGEKETFESAVRQKATGFEEFKPLFKQQHELLRQGKRKLAPFQGLHTITEGRFFVLGGLMLYVASVGDSSTRRDGRKKQRLRVIFENGTESAMYRQSLGIRMGEQNGRAVVHTTFSFADDPSVEVDENDVDSGHVYVLRTKSTDPQLTGLEDLYKIGYSRGSVEKRVANAHREPTYLMAPVEIVADYRIFNIKASAVESMLHQAFSSVRLDLSQVGIDGGQKAPSEWFMAPLEVINHAIELLAAGALAGVRFDKAQQVLVDAETGKPV